MNIEDITWSIKVNEVIKNKATGVVSTIRYTYSGSFNGVSSYIDNEELSVPYKNPTDPDFIPFDTLSEEDIKPWIESRISFCPVFDVELIRAPGIISNFTKEVERTVTQLDPETGEEIEVVQTITVVDEDHPKQPKNQDLSSFKFSSREEQMQHTIMNTIKGKIADLEAEKEEEIISFD